MFWLNPETGLKYPAISWIGHQRLPRRKEPELSSASDEPIHLTPKNVLSGF